MIKLQKRSSSLQPNLSIIFNSADSGHSTPDFFYWNGKCGLFMSLTVSVYPFLVIWSIQRPGSHANDAIMEETAIPCASTSDLWRSHWIKKTAVSSANCLKLYSFSGTMLTCVGAVPIKCEIYLKTRPVHSSKSHSWKQENTTRRRFPSPLALSILRHMEASHFWAMPT